MTPREQRIVRELVRTEIKRVVDRRLGEPQRMPLHVSEEARRIIRARSHCRLSRDRFESEIIAAALKAGLPIGLGYAPRELGSERIGEDAGS
jgi:hypothetical protein